MPRPPPAVLAASALVPLVVAAMLAAAPAASAACRPGEHAVTDDAVTAPDGTRIAITVMRTGAADCGPVPVVLHGHGWSGNRARGPGDSLTYAPARTFLDAGYGVISIDARGHGESGGQAGIMQPDAEITDYAAVLDHAHDELAWVQREPASPLPRDVVAGAYGGSYGGGWQHLTAALDGRLDALVPIITWWDLPEALVPNGVVRTDWAAALVAAGETNARLDPRISRWVVEGTATNRAPDEAIEHLARASPARFGDRLDTPTLMIQGLPDTLFTVDHAVAAFEALHARGVPVSLVGVNSGHILPVMQPSGVNAPPREGLDACVTDVVAHALTHLDAHLKGDAAARQRLAVVPPVALATEQGRCVAAAAWPLADRRDTVDLGDLAVPQGAGTVVVPVVAPEQDLTIAGRATFRATLPVALDDIFFLSLVVADAAGMHVVDDQITPYRVETAGAADTPVEVALTSVATTVPAGGRLLLRVDGLNEQFVAAGSRRPGVTPLLDASLTVPVVSAGTVGAVDTSRPEPPASPGGGAGAVAAPARPAPDPQPPPAPEGDRQPLPATGGGAVPALAGLAALLASAHAAASRRPR